MATLTLEEIQAHRVVEFVARALAVANEAALAGGMIPADSLVTIFEEPGSGEGGWRIHYGLRDYIGPRGGDLIVLVDERAAAVRRIPRAR